MTTGAESNPLENRRADVASALASFGMEGLKPDAETAAILECYVSGEITLDAMGSAIRSHVKQMEMKEAVSGAA
jgi:hypothetical protein